MKDRTEREIEAMAAALFRSAVRRNDPQAMNRLRQYDLLRVADYIDRLESEARRDGGQ